MASSDFSYLSFMQSWPNIVGRADYAVQAQCGDLSGKWALSHLSGNVCSQSSQLAVPLWTCPGLKSGVGACELISTKKKKSTDREWRVELSLKILAWEEKVMTTIHAFMWILLFPLFFVESTEISQEASVLSLYEVRRETRRVWTWTVCAGDWWAQGEPGGPAGVLGPGGDREGRGQCLGHQHAQQAGWEQSTLWWCCQRGV